MVKLSKSLNLSYKAVYASTASMTFMPSDDAHPMGGTFSEHCRRNLLQRQACTRTISSAFLYDERGSELFDRVTGGQHKIAKGGEVAILTERACELADAFPEQCAIVELGSGSSCKTEVVLDAFWQKRDQVTYLPIDISHGALKSSTSRLMEQYPNGLCIKACAGFYEQGLEYVQSESSGVAHLPKVVLFLGNSIANMQPSETAALMTRLMSLLGPADILVLGTSMVENWARPLPTAPFMNATDTKFFKNILTRMNTELGAQIDEDSWSHEATFNSTLGCVEMSVRFDGKEPLLVKLPALDKDAQIAVVPGEHIRCMQMFNYTTAQLDAITFAAGLQMRKRWLAPNGAFALTCIQQAAVHVEPHELLRRAAKLEQADVWMSHDLLHLLQHQTDRTVVTS